MKLRIRSPRDFYSGLIFLLFGSLAFFMARDYPLGSAVRMGPGYFPSVLGALLAGLGLVIVGRSLALEGPKVTGFALRSLILVLAAVLAFGLLLEPVGLVVATVALVVIGCLAGTEFRWRDVAILCVILIALALGLFVYGLGLPLKVWPV
ncbi:MAG TPA: tripartite tricarboxylate transporter TctB family protein [Burkholderiales bacterium]|nr:tripartite tricarboxylate transporter TctB family protein [Burkholderiales bacterium]